MVTARQLLGPGPDCIVKNDRLAQLLMTDLVGVCFDPETAGITLCEAGTGTGKSLAYMVQAMLCGMRVVVSTAKKALQQQLIEKDVPFLQNALKRHLPVVPEAASLKGKGNYACKLRVEELKLSDQFQKLPVSERAAFLEWLDSSSVGDLSELKKPFMLESGVRVTECVRLSCPFADKCGYVKAKDRASNPKTKIIIVNHALLAVDISLGGGKIFGVYDGVVMDEGHQAPQYLRDAYSLKLHHKQPEAVGRFLGNSDFELPEVFDRVYVEIFKKLSNRSEELDLPKMGLQTYFEDLYQVTDQAQQRMKGRGLLAEEDEGGGGEGNYDVAKAKAKLRAGAELVSKIRKAAQIALGLHVERDEEGYVLSGGEVDYVSYTTSAPRGGVSEIIVTPLEIGPLVAPVLQSIKKVFITSATLSANNEFNYIRREFGLNASEVKHSAILPHTFNYKSLACAYVSGTSPDPSNRDDGYYDAQAAEMHQLLMASKGGALVLCTSYDDMNKFHNAIRANHQNEINYNMGTQFGPIEPLIEWFKRTPNPVLFGVKSFWEGVDLPGLMCRLIIIPRLPFPNYGDVLLKARKARVADQLIEAGYEPNRASMQTWADFDLNEAIFDLKQGAGRLIRTETDMGVVAVLDKRAHPNGGKGYSGKVRGALPMPVTYDAEKAKAFLRILAGRYESEAR